MTEFRYPKDYKEGEEWYQAAADIAEALRGDFVQTSELAALHALLAPDKQETSLGPDFDLVAKAANMARQGYRVVDGEFVQVHKSAEKGNAGE